VWTELKHACNQVLELFSKEAGLVSIRVELPEELRLVGCQLLIKRFRGICYGEGWIISIHREEDHTQCKQINNVALISLFI
jgi:hypothetical protein